MYYVLISCLTHCIWKRILVSSFGGNYLDFNNCIHLLIHCDYKTTEGLLYGPTSHIWEPCLLENSINHCEWTIFHKF